MRELRGPSITLRLLSESEELLVMEAIHDGTSGQMPPPHLHPQQDEHFEVLEGAIRAVVDGDERVYAKGETIDVPAGTVHTMAADGPARMRWEVRPALKTAEFFTLLYEGGAGADFLERFSDEFRLAPPSD